MSKRLSPGTNQSKKKQKKEQSSVLSFFGSSSEPIDLTEDKNGNENDANEAKNKFSIYCDLDGVLADFNAGVKKINRGRGPDDLNSKQLWGSISNANGFFQNLPWMEDGKRLWSAIVSDGHTPDILTGVPFVKGCREQKFAWCKKGLKDAFGQEQKVFNHVDYAAPKKKHERVKGSMRTGDNVVNVITCWSKSKYCESKKGRVLIDDRAELGVKWIEAGGIFVHHTDTESTLVKMVELEILSANVLTSTDDRTNGKSSQPSSPLSNEVVCLD
eukprot:scaffold279_cov246-Chaetoceros_neogracile.AAC.1